MNKPVYANKEMQTIITRPTHGRAGWRKNENDEFEELIFSGPLNEWVSVQQYREEKNKKIRSNYEFYKAHPDLLSQKINVWRMLRGRASKDPAVTWPTHAW